MICLIAYDINENTKRDRLARYLEKKGKRIQHSVFILRTDNRKFSQILKDIDSITNGTGKIVVLRLCESCKRRAIQRGIDIRDLYVV